jgi:hypothetical protein
MFLNMIKFFGPGVTDFLRVMMEADSGTGGGGAGSSGGSGAAGEGGGAVSGNEDGQQVAVEAAQTREQLIALYRQRADVVPDMIGGATLAEINASLQAAQASFAALRDQILSPYQAAIEASQNPGAAQALGFLNTGTQRITPPAPAQVPPVSAGGAGAGKQAPGGVDVSKLSAAAKIAFGLNMKGQSR